MKLFIATNNPHKFKEIADILANHGIEVEPGPNKDLPEVDETGKDLNENAILKAAAGFRFSMMPTIADDSGLEVDYLGGAPGVHSARYAGEHCNYRDNNRKLLEELRGVPPEKRAARFKTVIALALDENDIRTVEGSVEGYITESPVGDSGFGYDPVFFYPPRNRTFAQLSKDEKNSVSHRSRALKELERLLETDLSGELKPARRDDSLH